MDDLGWGGTAASGQAAWVGGGTFNMAEEKQERMWFRKENESNCRP